MNKKLNVLFIKDENSMLETNAKAFTELFNKVEIAPDKHKALKLIYANEYDIIIHDITTDPIYGTTFTKQIKDMKPKQVQVALVAAKDEENIGGLIDFGVHTFLLTPEQLDQALEVISQMDTTPKQ